MNKKSPRPDAFAAGDKLEKAGRAAFSLQEESLFARRRRWIACQALAAFLGLDEGEPVLPRIPLFALRLRERMGAHMWKGFAQLIRRPLEMLF
jgi:hypothetical protein